MVLFSKVIFELLNLFANPFLYQIIRKNHCTGKKKKHFKNAFTIQISGQSFFNKQLNFIRFGVQDVKRAFLKLKKAINLRSTG